MTCISGFCDPELAQNPLQKQVQYMAGHKYISSTEKYAAQEVEDLQDALAKHHPFG